MIHFVDSLFARQDFTANFLEHSFKQPNGLLDLALSFLLAAAAFWFSGVINRRLNQRPPRYALLRHLRQRLIWPLLILVFAVTALAISRHYGQPAVWLQLLALAARWMVLIRAAVAIVHAALPQNRMSDWLERLVAWVLWAGFVLWVSGLDDSLILLLQNVRFNVGSVTLNLYSILSGIVWICILMVAALWLAKLIGERLSHSRLNANLSMILSKIITTALVVLSVLIALPLVGIDLTVLSVFSGALGVGIGFGLQKIASNYISGFIILGDRSIRINDRLNVNGFSGNVTQITSRFVVLRAANGTEALIPNETFMTSTVINESYTDRTLMQSFAVQIAYDSDLDKALEILRQVAASQPRVRTSPAPSSLVTDFAADGINLSLSYWVSDPENGLGGLKSDIMLEIRRQFAQQGIEFPYPQREVRLINAEMPSAKQERE
ncbi:mechanosensitive ion channel family protein [Neisseria animalis]|uniref:Mechanosensitive ion channel protein MscS n=1 Tax=Neisseria animalis TaxID=492 RepID=A0A5P3MS11_NEIAN|nr:mechanosensitive ion channel domain-containing protein [Neisseria animalis]QEY24382.1 hypothetical protein D0T90_07750 [Neisseria animalis]ROW31448.1 hypothetical protein CGZ60_10290 [Neisseria animalis]VEE06920.1 membrane protein [Neisseria animalis]